MRRPRPYPFAAACAALAVVFLDASAMAADTGGPVWQLDLARKTMKNPDPVAVNENAIITVKPIGTSVATNLLIVFTDRKDGTELAFGRSFEDASSYSNAAVGAVALNTDEMHKRLEKLPKYGEVETLVTLWDEADRRMLAQDFVRVINNPMVTNWIEVVTTNTIYNLDAEITELRGHLRTLDGSVGGLQSGLATETDRAQEAEYDLLARLEELGLVVGDFTGNTFTSVTGALWSAIGAESNRAVEAEGVIATNLASVSNAFDAFATSTYPQDKSDLWTAIDGVQGSLTGIVYGVERNGESSAPDTNGIVHLGDLATSNELSGATNALWDALDGVQGSLTGVVYGIAFSNDYIRYLPDDEGLVTLPEMLPAEAETNFVHGIIVGGTEYPPDGSGGFFVELPPYPVTDDFATRTELTNASSATYGAMTNALTNAISAEHAAMLSAVQAERSAREAGDATAMSWAEDRFELSSVHDADISALSNRVGVLDGKINMTAGLVDYQGTTAAGRTALSNFFGILFNMQTNTIPALEGELFFATNEIWAAIGEIAGKTFFDGNTNGAVWTLGNDANNGTNSFTVGYQNEAGGMNAFASGEYTDAGGEASFTCGVETEASGYCTFAAGHQAKATNDISFVWNGQSTLYGSQGDRSFCINPENGFGGFFIGETNLLGFLSNNFVKATYNEHGPRVGNPGYEIDEPIEPRGGIRLGEKTIHAWGDLTDTLSGAIATNAEAIASNTAAISETSNTLERLLFDLEDFFEEYYGTTIPGLEDGVATNTAAISSLEGRVSADEASIAALEAAADTFLPKVEVDNGALPAQTSYAFGKGILFTNFPVATNYSGITDSTGIFPTETGSGTTNLDIVSAGQLFLRSGSSRVALGNGWMMVDATLQPNAINLGGTTVTDWDDIASATDTNAILAAVATNDFASLTLGGETITAWPSGGGGNPLSIGNFSFAAEGTGDRESLTLHSGTDELETMTVTHYIDLADIEVTYSNYAGYPQMGYCYFTGDIDTNLQYEAQFQGETTTNFSLYLEKYRTGGFAWRSQDYFQDPAGGDCFKTNAAGIVTNLAWAYRIVDGEYALPVVTLVPQTMDFVEIHGNLEPDALTIDGRSATNWHDMEPAYNAAFQTDDTVHPFGNKTWTHREIKPSGATERVWISLAANNTATTHGAYSFAANKGIAGTSGDYNTWRNSGYSSAFNMGRAQGYGSFACGWGIASDFGAFAWAPGDSETATPSYASHGFGTFNVAPANGLRGFYVGETNLSDHIAAEANSHYACKWTSDTLSEAQTNFIPTNWPARNLTLYILDSETSPCNVAFQTNWIPPEDCSITIIPCCSSSSPKARNFSLLVGNQSVYSTTGKSTYRVITMRYDAAAGTWLYTNYATDQPYTFKPDGTRCVFTAPDLPEDTFLPVHLPEEE